MAATTMEDLHDDVATGFLGLLDCQSLAAAMGATRHLRAIAGDREIWRRLCVDTWPSLTGVPGSLPSAAFFSQVHPFPDLLRPLPGPPRRLLSSLVSAVDLYHDGEPVFSRAVEFKASSQWFLGAPFRIDALDRKDQSPPPAAVTPSGLALSWIVIDLDEATAVNLSSRRPVLVERHWYTGETVARFAVVAREGGLREAAVTAVVCVGEEGRVREVSLVVEDLDGVCMNGRESLAVIEEAIEGGRMAGRGETGEEERRRRYKEHMGRRKERKEMRMRREGTMDTCCVALGVAVFLAFFFLVIPSS